MLLTIWIAGYPGTWYATVSGSRYTPSSKYSITRTSSAGVITWLGKQQDVPGREGLVEERDDARIERPGEVDPGHRARRTGRRWA